MFTSKSKFCTLSLKIRLKQGNIFISLYFNISLRLSNLDIIVQHSSRQCTNLSTSQHQNT